MIDFPLRVYISSSWKGDLNAERESIERLIKEELLMHPVYSRGSDLEITSDYFVRLNVCDITVVLLGSKYSWHVENEFRYALDQEISTLVFAKECEREKELEDKIKSLYRVIPTTPFKDVTELRKVVKERIIELLGRKFQEHRKIEKAIKSLIGEAINITPPKSPEGEYKGVPRINPFERG